MSYTLVVSKTGKEMYYLDGKLVSKKTIPADELAKLSGETQMDTVQPVVEQPTQMDEAVGIFTRDEDGLDEPEEEDKSSLSQPLPEFPRKCVFCGKDGTHTRPFQTRSVYLCEGHYLTTTLGEVAQAVKEKGLV